MKATKHSTAHIDRSSKRVLRCIRAAKRALSAIIAFHRGTPGVKLDWTIFIGVMLRGLPEVA